MLAGRIHKMIPARIINITGTLENHAMQTIIMISRQLRQQVIPANFTRREGSADVVASNGKFDFDLCLTKSKAFH